MKKPLLVALFAAATLAPIGAAQAGGGVFVSVSTPEFGFRIGAPVYSPPVYAPVYVPPVYVPPVYIPPMPMPRVYAPPVVVVPPPRVIYQPVVVSPRVAYRPVYAPRPRFDHRHFDAPYEQQAAYRVPPGHGRGHRGHGHDD